MKERIMAWSSMLWQRKRQRVENCGICSGRLYGSKQLVFKSSHYSQQEATEISGEQFQPVLPSTGKVAREGRPEQARMLTSASASFRLPGSSSSARRQRSQPRERHIGRRSTTPFWPWQHLPMYNSRWSHSATAVILSWFVYIAL